MIHIGAPQPVDISISPMNGKALIWAGNARNIDIPSCRQELHLIYITDHKAGMFIKTEKMIKQ